MSYEPPSYGSPPPPPGGGYGAPPPPPGGGYGAPPGGYGGYGAPPPGYGGQPTSTSTLGIVSLVAGILSIVCCFCYGIGIVPGIAAVITGVMSRKEIAQSGGAKTGSGLALGGLITGGAGIALSVIGWIIVLVFGAIDYTTY
ncbi:DUF4190 domain-containing protein [Nocardioides stalactiti]|uniref:DUF4190 domain-containing protein n=1 Tax=Nocardioides stalactiti TaxID=2755356 RepID=UPI0015FFB7D4|nr:DUF4190 domain-containing protein [Nocardioides stalactiti]